MTDTHTCGDHIRIIRELHAFDMPIQHVKLILLMILWQEIAYRTERQVLEAIQYAKWVIKTIINESQRW